jgi:hypothetical protein
MDHLYGVQSTLTQNLELNPSEFSDFSEDWKIEIVTGQAF